MRDRIGTGGGRPAGLAAALALALCANGCVFDAHPFEEGDIRNDADVRDDADARDVPCDIDLADAEPCGALPDCDVVLAGCTEAIAGQCFECCAWSGLGIGRTQVCCPGQDVIQDVPPDEAFDVPPDGDLDLPPDEVVDATDEDVPPECGQVICIDCACTCSDGRMLPYGGCFDDCNPPPPMLLECSADCDAMCGETSPRECWNEGIPGDCDPGQACVRTPCPHCGMLPPAYCVTAPCEGGCYVDPHCGDGMACHGASVPTGVMGVCEAPPAEAIGCWTSADCPTGAICVGAETCPPCAVCDAEDRPGSCRLQQGQEAVVLLWIPGSMFAPGETLLPIWYDFTDDDIYLPGCSKYSVEKREGMQGEWIDLGPPVMCGWEGIAQRVAAGQAYRDFPLALPPEFETSPYPSWRLHGQYWTGCQPDLPLSAAGCTAGPFDVYSREYTVGLAP